MRIAKNRAAQTRARTKAALQRIVCEQKREMQRLRKEKARAQHSAKAWAQKELPKFIRTCLREIDQAADQGRKEVCVFVATVNGKEDITEWDWGLVGLALPVLFAAGYNAQHVYDYQPLAGLDDVYGGVTHHFIEVSW